MKMFGEKKGPLEFVFREGCPQVVIGRGDQGVRPILLESLFPPVPGYNAAPSATPPYGRLSKPRSSRSYSAFQRDNEYRRYN